MNARRETVQVNLGDATYRIRIGPGLIHELSVELKPWLENRHALVVSDSKVAGHWLPTVVDQLTSFTRKVDTLVVPEGEPSKSVKTCDQLWQEMIGLQADRSTIVVALGGGVVGDLAGFLAATFGRGIPFIQIPTTLLAQVDSSVGGKVGINLPQAKNMVGAFWQPKHVLIDPLVLETLDEANFRAGMAEVIKYGLIMDRDFFDRLQESVEPLNQRNATPLTQVIARSCQCKAEVVEADEKETAGRRVILNYGHTYGHAIESVFGYGKFLHGEAIAIGMTCAARLAIRLGMVSTEFLSTQTRLFRDYGLPTDCPVDRHQELVDAMKHDKKVADGKLHLILPTEIGNVVSVPAPDDSLILESLSNQAG